MRSPDQIMRDMITWLEAGDTAPEDIVGVAANIYSAMSMQQLQTDIPDPKDFIKLMEDIVSYIDVLVDTYLPMRLNTTNITNNNAVRFVLAAALVKSLTGNNPVHIVDAHELVNNGQDYIAINMVEDSEPFNPMMDQSPLGGTLDDILKDIFKNEEGDKDG